MARCRSGSSPKALWSVRISTAAWTSVDVIEAGRLFARIWRGCTILAIRTLTIPSSRTDPVPRASSSWLACTETQMHAESWGTVSPAVSGRKLTANRPWPCSTAVVREARRALASSSAVAASKAWMSHGTRPAPIACSPERVGTVYSAPVPGKRARQRADRIDAKRSKR